MESKKEHREYVATSDYMMQQRHAMKNENSVTTENAIWARILGILNVTSNLGPKLLGLYKYKQFEESEAISLRKKNQSIWELRTLLYYIFILFLFIFLHRLDLA